MTGQHRIVVLGAGYAGLAAARRLARKARGAEITVVDPRQHFVERVRLHQQAAGQRISAWDIRELLARKEIGFVRARATIIDTAGRRVLLDTGTELGYDSLVYALGSVADLDGVPGVAEHAHSVATPEDADRFVAPDGTVVVVGSGSTGIELAAELGESRPQVRVLLLGSEAPGAWLSPRAQAHIRRVLEQLGVEIRSDAKVIEVTEQGVRLADGTLLEAAATVWTAGFRVPDLAQRSGIAVDGMGRVHTDATLRSISHPEIYAAGDCAVMAGPADRALRMACATALPAGRQVADAIAAHLRGAQPRPLRFRYVGQAMSLGRRNGIIQSLHADDSPAGFILTGRTAAWVKERVVRGAARQTRP
ncbi:NAD(P)/FAD-dependent oxidoreductase [Nocardia brasiliensis]